MLIHPARARPLEAGICPTSRGELPGQLRDMREHDMAYELADALSGQASASDLLALPRPPAAQVQT